jgi:hypothetical protein
VSYEVWRLRFAASEVEFDFSFILLFLFDFMAGICFALVCFPFPFLLLIHHISIFHIHICTYSHILKKCNAHEQHAFRQEDV